MSGKYDDIINLPHHVSDKRPQMSMQDRAAQFSPFAALTGYDGEIKEAARLTDSKIELDEYEKQEVDEMLQLILRHIGKEFEVIITYFLPDERKAGGSYVDVTGIVKKLDEYERLLVMRDGIKIPIDDILKIEIKSELAENNK